MDIAKTAAWIRRALSGLFAVLMAIGSSLSGEPYIASGDAELKRSLLYSYAEGVSFMQGIACDGDGCLHDGKLYIALEDYGFRHPGVITYF